MRGWKFLEKNCNSAMQGNEICIETKSSTRHNFSNKPDQTAKASRQEYCVFRIISVNKLPHFKDNIYEEKQTPCVLQGMKKSSNWLLNPFTLSLPI